MSRNNERDRDPSVRVKEVLERGFADLYDAFADMDTDEDGKVSLHDFQQSIKNLEGGDAFLVCHQRVKTTTSLPPHQTHTGSPLPSGTLVWRAALVCVTLRTRPEASRTW